MISEAQRFEMHSKLRTLMGDEVANTLMEHLPPSGWADVARKSDVDRLEVAMKTDIERLEVDITRVEVALRSDIERLESEIARVEKSLRADIQRLEIEIARVEKSLRADIQRLEIAMKADIERLDKRMNHLVAGMWAMASIMTTGFVGLFALIATKL